MYQAHEEEVPHIKDDLSPLFQNLQNNPRVGDPIPGWHRKIWRGREGEREDITKA